MMPKNLLLDTNILRRLASKVEPSTLLKHLAILIKNNYVRLLVPETLAKEWKKHRVQQMNAITTELKKTQKAAKTRAWGSRENDVFTDEQFRAKEKELHQQIHLIDELVLNYAQQIKLTPAVTYKVYQQKESGHAPFHEKNSENDALIAFSALEYCDQTGPKELYFVSDNTTDFASKEDNRNILHHDIQDIFPTVKVHYCSDIREAFALLSETGILAYSETIRTIPNQINNTIKVNREGSVLNQLYEYLEKRSEQLPFVPKKILIEHFPFITQPSFQLHHRPFTVVTDNEQLNHLLTNLEINGNGILCHDPSFSLTEGDRSKIEEIFSFLHGHFLANISLNDRQSIELKNYRPGEQCECPVCLYQRLDLAGLLSSLKETPSSVPETMKQAYGLYKLGKFLQAANVFLGLKRDWKEGYNLTYYIICFNLVNLGYIIRQSYYPWPNECKHIQEAISEINLQDVYAECYKPGTQPLLDWIHEKTFFKEPFLALHETLKQITDHFHAQNTGYNEYTNELIETYFLAERFLTANWIVYDVFGDFLSLTDLFTEGLFASYGCNQLMGGKLSYFSDSICQKLLLHGRSENMIKYFRRYKLNAIEYRGDDSRSKTISIIKSVLYSYYILAADYEKHKDSYQEYFWDQYTELVFNGITLLGILDFQENDINDIAHIMYELFKNPHHLQSFHLSKILQFFIGENRQKLNEKMLEKFFSLGLTNLHFIPDNYTDNLKTLIQNRGFKISIPTHSFNEFKRLFLGNSEDQRSLSWHTIGNVYAVLKTGKQRSIIHEFVVKSLRENFLSRNFYVAAMFDIIEPNEAQIQLYHQDIANILHRGQQPRPFNDKPFYFDSRINDYLNFLFKYKIPITDEIKTGIKRIGIYYEWLSDPETFDYKHFNRHWINYYFTLFFKRHFRKSKKLKQVLLNSFKQHPDFDIEHRFLLIYCYND